MASCTHSLTSGFISLISLFKFSIARLSPYAPKVVIAATLKRRLVLSKFWTINL